MKARLSDIIKNWKNIPPCPVKKCAPRDPNIKSIRVIEITNNDSGISGMLMASNPISKKLMNKIVREWNKAPKLIIFHDNK
jgi:hypothetical protein